MDSDPDTSVDRIFDSYGRAFGSIHEWADRHLPYGSSLFFATVAYLAMYCVLVFVVDTAEWLAGGTAAWEVQIAVYIVPLLLAVVGFQYGGLADSRP